MAAEIPPGVIRLRQRFVRSVLSRLTAEGRESYGRVKLELTATTIMPLDGVGRQMRNAEEKRTCTQSKLHPQVLLESSWATFRLQLWELGDLLWSRQ